MNSINKSNLKQGKRSNNYQLLAISVKVHNLKINLNFETVAWNIMSQLILVKYIVLPSYNSSYNLRFQYLLGCRCKKIS